MTRLTLFLLAGAGLVLMSCHLEASCCSSASAGGIPRLLPHERALIDLASAVRYQYGFFDQEAAVALGHHAHAPHLIFEEELSAMARIFGFFEPFVRIPVRVQESDIRRGAGLADLSIGARMPIFRDNYFRGFPSLTLTQAVRMPTGASLKDDSTLDNEHILGSGAWQFTLGLLLEKSFHPITIGLGYSLSFEPDNVINTSKKPGILHAPLATLSFMPSELGTLSFSLAPTFYTPVMIQNRSIPNSDRRKLSFSTGYSLMVHSHIRLHGSLGADIPIPYLGKNANSEIFFKLGMRLGVF
jgi:hypothetical protein